VYKEGLVDCLSEEEFDVSLQSLKEIWNDYEQPFAPAAGPQFHSYFRRYQAEVVKYHMRKDLREAVGLGSPPNIFTTNISESVNAMIKKKVYYKEQEWPKFNEHLKQLKQEQRDLVMRREPVWHALSAGKCLILSVSRVVGSIRVTPIAFNGMHHKYAVVSLGLLKSMDS
jgi:hypothetical protein